MNIALVREHAAAVKPPRALVVPFPFGYALGRTDDADYQHRVLWATLGLLTIDKTPVLAEWQEDETRPVRLVQSSHVEHVGPAVADPANEVTKLRAFYERWVDGSGGRTGVGISGVPERQFRKLVRFLEVYAAGDEGADVAERSSGVSVPQYIRYAVDDLKAFYYEARMAQRKDQSPAELHAWFWGETAMARLIGEVAARLEANDEPALKALAFGIAR